MMLEGYYLRGEVQKLEQELWNLTMNCSDIEAYTARFSDLAILCPRMITSERKKVERFIWGLSTQIQGNVTDANLTTFDSAKRLAQKLIEHGIRKGIMTPITEQKKGNDKKRKFGRMKMSQPTQEPVKKQLIVVVHAATTPAAPAPTKPYAGTLPKCAKCNFHQKGVCREMHCTN